MGRQDARTLLHNIRSSVERFNCYFSFVRSFLPLETSPYPTSIFDLLVGLS